MGLEYDKMKAEDRLRNLQQEETYQNGYQSVGTGEIRGGLEVTKTVGSEKEIKEQREYLEDIKQRASDKVDAQIKSAAAPEGVSFEYQVKEREKKEKQAELERSKIAEQYRLNTFKRVKQSYKSKSIFTRVLYTIQGRRPDFSKIMGYSQNELDFLISTKNGETKEQEKFYSQQEERMQKEGVSFKEIRETINKGKWNDFIKKLNNSKLQLDNAIEVEEHHKAGRLM